MFLPVVIFVLVDLRFVLFFDFFVAVVSGVVPFFIFLFDELFLEGTILFLLSLIGVIVWSGLNAIIVVELLVGLFLGVGGTTLLMRLVLFFSLSCWMRSSRDTSAI